MKSTRGKARTILCAAVAREELIFWNRASGESSADYLPFLVAVALKFSVVRANDYLSLV